MKIVRVKNELDRTTYRFKQCQDTGVCREYRPTKRYKLRCITWSRFQNHPQNALPAIPDDVIAEAVAHFRDRVAYRGEWG